MSERRSNNNWRDQLQQTVSEQQNTTASSDTIQSSRAQVVRLIKDTVIPAVDEFAAEMKNLGRECLTSQNGNVVTIEVRANRQREFIYGIKVESRQRSPLDAVKGSVMKLVPGNSSRRAAYKAGGAEKQYHPTTTLSLKQAQSWSKQDFIDELVKKYQETVQRGISGSN